MDGRVPAPVCGEDCCRVLNYVRGGYREIEPASETMLQDQGILRLETERYTGELHTGVNKVLVLIVGVLSVIKVTLMYIGGGNMLTWISSGFFILLLLWFTWLSVRPSSDPRPEQQRVPATD